jgi:hypothetical protein
VKLLSTQPLANEYNHHALLCRAAITVTRMASIMCRPKVAAVAAM